jgi:FkbM family methyltransferase
MKSIKKIIKYVFGLKNTQILNEFVNRTFKTKGYRETLIHNQKMSSFYSRFVGKNELCFDVGANLGDRSNIFLSMGAKVVAVEPQKDLCQYLDYKFGKKINVVNKALGEKPELKDMFISYYSSSLSSLSTEWINDVKKNIYTEESWDKVNKVEVTTLDLLIKEYGKPAFIKIDVEGYELEVLKGLSTPVNMLSFEYLLPDRKQKAIECLNLIKMINPESLCNYSIGENMEFENTEWIPIDNMIFNIDNNKLVTPSIGDIYIKNKNLEVS